MHDIHKDTITLLHGNSLALLPTLPADSIDAVVTDPPYELGFMGKAWDNSGIAYNTDLWREVFRVLKPGGHLLSFGGTRTYHRMAVAIEDAGFEIRDMIEWLYGQGFPKSMDVSKAIDKAAGKQGEVIGQGKGAASSNTISLGVFAPTYDITAPATDEAAQWQGWGTALKPAHEPIVVARKPLSEKTVARQVQATGTGAINIGASRIGTEGATKAIEYGELAGAIYGNGKGKPKNQVEHLNAGRWPANVILNEEAAAVLDRQSGNSGGGTHKTTARSRNNGIGLGTNTERSGLANSPDNYGDIGGASRFFYTAKPGKQERPVGPDGTLHPTVKPLALMRYLVRMVTPPGGTVLDPFAGSGATIEAAIMEGFRAVGMELTAEYIPLIQYRVARATNQGKESADV